MKRVLLVKVEDQGKCLREFILAQGVSAKALKRIKTKGQILCNGEPQTVRYIVQATDCITLCFPHEESAILPQNIPFTIYYEDSDYLVVYKPSGMPCIPTKRYPDQTLANALMYYYQECHIPATIHLVNRLDKDTKGLLVVAKHSYGHALLSKDIKQIHREYHCLVSGCLEGTGTIDSHIEKAKEGIHRIIASTGKRAITHYEVIKQYQDTTLVRCVLETGRTHQIRVHMASIGHPLVGDVLYGTDTEGHFYLESVAVSFLQPITKTSIHITI